MDIRAGLVALLVLYLLPTLVQVVRPDFAESLRSGSKLYALVAQMDFLDVRNLVKGLIGG